MLTRKAIILAAGLGSRLRPLTNTEHKCMTKICGTPIIYNALKMLDKNSFDEVIIVVGYLREKLQKQILAMDINVPIKFAVNDIYDKTNTVYSLQKGLEAAREYDEMYIIEGDVFFEESVLAKLIVEKEKNATVLERYRPDLEGSFVELDCKKYVIDWRHKTTQGTDYQLENKYKTVNLHKFSKEFMKKIFEPALNDFVLKNGYNNPIEYLFRTIVADNEKLIKGEVLKGENWYEIDDMHDLRKAEEIFGGVL